MVFTKATAEIRILPEETGWTWTGVRDQRSSEKALALVTCLLLGKRHPVFINRGPLRSGAQLDTYISRWCFEIIVMVTVFTWALYPDG